MKAIINLNFIIFLLLFSNGLLAQNDLLNEGATIKKDTIVFIGNSTYANINTKSWDQILAENTLRWESLYTVHLPVQPVYSPDFIFPYDEYKPYYCDASKWMPCDIVKLENNLIVKNNNIIGKIVPGSMNVKWENEAHFQANDSINKFDANNKYFSPAICLKAMQDVIYYRENGLRTKEGREYEKQHESECKRYFHIV